MAKWTLADASSVMQNLTAQQENEISLLYKQVYNNVKKELKNTPKDGTVSQQIQYQYLTGLSKELNAAYKSLGVGLQASIKANAKKAAAGVVASSDALLSKVGFSIKGAFYNVPRDIVASIASGQLYSGNWTLNGAIWRSITQNQSDINKILAAGIARNASAYDIAKALEQYINPNAKKPWDWSKVYPGTSKKVDYNAQRLARTTISHAYQQSLEAVCKDNPFAKGYIWISSHDAKTCPICADRDGQFYKKGQLPLDHPNGRCTFEVDIPPLTDVAKRLKDWVQGGDDPELDNYQASMLGKESTGPKFSDLQKKWLEQLGYSPENMPKDFTEFAMKLSYEQQSEFLYEAGGNWGLEHPYQFMEAYYNKNLASVRSGIVPTEQAAATNTGFNREEWFELIKKRTLNEVENIQAIQQKDFTSETIQGLYWYTGSGYRNINGYLRMLATGSNPETAIRENGLSDSNIKSIDNIIQAFNNTELGQQFVLRRGTDLGDLAGFMQGDFETNKRLLSSKSITELQQQFVGTVGTYAGFTSTSSLYDAGFSGSVEMLINAPANIHGASITNLSMFPSEGETLLNAGTMVRIVGIEKSDGHMDSTIRVFAEIIP